MTTTLDDQMTVPMLALYLIDLHPANPRIDATADDELVESVRQQGVLDPLMIAPSATNAERFVLIDGHRRHDAATRAGLIEVPVNPRYDLVTEAQQIEVMVITGVQKDLLTPVEEAAGYEQLTLLGMDVDAIATSTGFSKSRVKSRLRLNGLSEDVRRHVHAGDATLADAEALLEFADDAEQVERLEELLGSNNFRYEVEAARSRRERRARHQAIVDGYIELGATESTSSGTWRSLRSFADTKFAEPAAHKGCLAWIGDVDSYSEPYLVCETPDKHKTKTTPASEDEPELSDWEKRREERAAAHAAAVAATAARLTFLREHLTGLFPSRGNSALAVMSKALLPLLILDDRGIVDEGTMLAAYEVTPEPGASYAETEAVKGALAAGFTAASTGKALGGLALYFAIMIAEQLGNDPEYAHDPAQVQHQLNLWDWMADAGHVMSDVDIADRAALESRLVELGDD